MSLLMVIKILLLGPIILLVMEVKIRFKVVRILFKMVTTIRLKAMLTLLMEVVIKLRLTIQILMDQ